MPGFHFESPFQEVAALLLLASGVGALALLLRQPLIVAFIVAGVLVGPDMLGWVKSADEVTLLAEFGISVLLFVVGLKLDLALVRSIGWVSLVTGLGQVVVTSAIGFAIALAFGMAPVNAIYVAIALTFSSTIIVVKLLSDKREIDSLHGQISLGLLIVQDILVVLTMIVLAALEVPGQEGGLWQGIALVFLKGAALLIGASLLGRYAFPRLLHRLARSMELLMLFAIAWAVALAGAAEMLGFSKEVGAFLGGVTLASTHYREAISARLVSLRDFMLLFFFIALGAKIELALLAAQVGLALVFSLFVLASKPLIVMALMGLMGYRKRTGFLTGVNMAQISEFSLILAALGLSLGHLTPEAVGLITLVGLITIGLSTYLILYANPIYAKLAPYLGVFERKVPYSEPPDDSEAESAGEIIQFGLGRYGSALVRSLARRGLPVLGVDFDPAAVRHWKEQGITTRYGDADDAEFLETLPLTRARWVVSTLPLKDTNLVLIHALRQHGYEGRVAVTAHALEDAVELEFAGADVVLLPFLDAAEEAADILSGAARAVREGAPCADDGQAPA